MIQAPNGMKEGKIMTPQNIGAAVMNADNVKCECGSTTFLQAVELKKLSALVSPSGQNELVPMPAFICSSCGKVLDLSKINDKSEANKEEKSSLTL